jgi:glycerol-3-phosphate dehydrogenase (NAD(P)+)
MRIAVIGAGSWGTALAIIAGRAGHEVVLWSRNESVVQSINNEHVNSAYLTQATVPDAVHAVGHITEALTDEELIVLAAPSHATRGLLEAMGELIPEESIIVSATKGIETDTGMRISQVVNEVLGSSFTDRFVCLSGPSFAKEVVNKHPTAIVAAGTNEKANRLVQSSFSFENLRVYTNNDVVGTELGGSVKNVMAIAAGMVAGLGFGANSVAALITRGLAEITRLAMREGGKLETMMGLAGLGDLVLTCTGDLSRNRYVGRELAMGRSLEEITSHMNEVAEGVNTTLAVKLLADCDRIEMPITNEVHAVLYEGKSALEAANELMNRPLREETY